MQSLTFHSNYKHNKMLRDSFNNLAEATFGGLNFEHWYECGYWDERYVPYSYADNGQIVANVSVSFLDFIVEGEMKKAIQIGTVMTHPDYRGQGLSAKLMNIVIETYEDECDFMYLFANDKVLDFYPKFGFKRASESTFELKVQPAEQPYTLRKLNPNDDEQRAFIHEIAAARAPISQKFSTLNTPSLFMFYCLYVFEQEIYYIEENETIIAYKEDEGHIDIFDIVSKDVRTITEILSHIPNIEAKPFRLHFTADEATEAIATLDSSTNLFVRTFGSFTYPPSVLHPYTSRA